MLEASVRHQQKSAGHISLGLPLQGICNWIAVPSFIRYYLNDIYTKTIYPIWFLHRRPSGDPKQDFRAHYMATSVRYRDRLVKMAKEGDRENELLKSQILGSRRRLQQTKTLIQNKENKLKQVRRHSSFCMFMKSALGLSQDANVYSTSHLEYWKGFGQVKVVFYLSSTQSNSGFISLGKTDVRPMTNHAMPWLNFWGHLDGRNNFIKRCTDQLVTFIFTHDILSHYSLTPCPASLNDLEKKLHGENFLFPV